MGSIAAVLSAIAGSLAAALAGANIRIAGRREHTKWIREATVEAFVGVLDGSYRAKEICKALGREMRAGETPCRDESSAAESAAADMLPHITRLRLLTNRDLVVAASRLSNSTREYIGLFSESSAAATQADDDDARARISRDRDAFVAVAQKFLSL